MTPPRRLYVSPEAWDEAVALGLARDELLCRVGIPGGAMRLTVALRRGEVVETPDGRIVPAAGAEQLALFGPVGAGARIPQRASAPTGPSLREVRQ